MAAPSTASPIHARIRRHTMLATQPAPSIQPGMSPGRRAYPSPPNSERAAVSGGGVDIKKKPRAMSEMGGEAGSMICETCGKGYKHASCLSKHRYSDSWRALMI
jgi:hypothetical protein